MKTIAYQGVKGAFSYMTAVNEFGENNIFLGLPTFHDVFESVENGQADMAVIPIENSLIGSIYENYDLLNHYEMQIVGEHFTKIEHCLLGISKVSKNIKKVISHPKALAQCSHFFQSHPWIEAVVHMDTAAAAAEVALHRDPTIAAIASAFAGKLYRLEILEKGIEDDSNNYTRFVAVTKTANNDIKVDKCSLLLKLKNTPGSLMEVLKLFAEREINLTKIESRPLRGTFFEYLFYLDIEFDEKERVEDALQVLEKGQSLKILGFYKRGSYGKANEIA